MARSTGAFASGLTRREFAERLGAAGLGTVLARGAEGAAPPRDIASAPASPSEAYWRSVREQFLQPPDLAVMNAANLCPSPIPVVEAMVAATRDMDRDPSFPNRVKMGEGKEATRKLLAEFLRVTPEEIVIARNTSEASNLVSSGLDLKAGDEVLLFSDNHPSNLEAWKTKAKRFGYTVKVVDQVNPHPGDEYYLEAFTRETTDRTKVLGFTHLTSTVGDLLPGPGAMPPRARSRSADAGGRRAVAGRDGRRPADMQPDFYTGSGHKWPCGPKEVGVLYVHKAVQPRSGRAS